MAFNLGKLGTAIVEIRARSGKLRDDFRNARRVSDREAGKMASSLKRKGASIGKALGVAAVGAGAAAAAISALVVKSIRAADEIGKTADAIGIGVEALQEYRFAASQSGATQEEFTTAIRSFSKRVNDADIGLETYTRTFDRLGISVRDSEGELRSVEDLLPEVADSMAQLSSTTERTALAQELFGRSGVSMVNLLEKGSDGIEEMSQKARDLGRVINERMVRESERANDEIDRMQKAAGAAALKLGVSLTPNVVRLGEAAERWAPKVAEFIDAFSPEEIASEEELARRLGGAMDKLAAAQNRPGFNLGPLAFGGTDPHEIERRREAVGRLFDAMSAARESELRGDAAAEGKREREKAARKAEQLIMLEEELASKRDSLAESTRRATEMQREMNAAQAEFAREIMPFLSQPEELSPWPTEHAVSGPDFDAMAEGAGDLVDELALSNEHLAQMGSELEQLQFEEKWGTALSALQAFSGEFSRAMADMLVEGKFTFDQLVKSIAKSLLSLQFNKWFQLLFSSLGPATGTTAGVPSGGARARGGPVSPGRVYTVGERGPEMFVPDVAGEILPAGETPGGGGGITINQSLVIPAGMNAAMRQELAGSKPIFKQWAREAVVEAVRRSPSVSRAIKGS